MSYKIYCDLDGCLGDFDSRFKQFSEGLSPKEFVDLYGEEKFWNIIDEAGVRFWVGIQWLSEGKKLWGYIKKHNPIILSAPSRHETSKIGKRLWLRNNLSGFKMILTPAQYKKKYANPNSILIDDYVKNIEDWKKSGGIGLHYDNNLSHIIKELKKLGI